MHGRRGRIYDAVGSLAHLRKSKALAPDSFGHAQPSLGEWMRAASFGVAAREDIVRRIQKKDLRRKSILFQFSKGLRPFRKKEPFPWIDAQCDSSEGTVTLRGEPHRTWS